MKIAILSRAYPTPRNRYNYTFVHRRATRYDDDHDVQVFVLNDEVTVDYEFEGVDVLASTQADAVEHLVDYDPDVLFVHTPISKWLSLSFDMFDVVDEAYAAGIPYATWIHGHEALIKQLYHPPDEFEGLPTSPYEALWVVRRGLQLYKMRKFLKASEQRGMPTIFVSEWLKDAVETSVQLRFDTYEIIPNPIDTELFSFQPRRPEQATKLLSIRPFRPKYANEDTIRALAEVEDVHLDLYGKGPMKDELEQLAADLDANVDIHERFFSQQEIADLHQEYGVYVSPSRSDAQGVSMCEAMSSGLPVISSPVQAIPEFVPDGEAGFLCETPTEIAEKIRFFRDNPEEMRKMGEYASEFIEEKSGTETVIQKDVRLARGLVD